MLLDNSLLYRVLHAGQAWSVKLSRTQDPSGPSALPSRWRRKLGCSGSGKQLKKRAASAPVRLAVAEARAARQASNEARQVQAKRIKAAKQAARFDRKVATAAAAAAKQAAKID